MKESTLIRAIQLSRSYQMGDGWLDAIRQLDLQIDPGDYCLLFGSSGSGKTTLLNLLSTLDTPTRGELWFGDTPLHNKNSQELARFRRNRIGFVFQSFNLIPVFNAFQNIEYPLLLDQVPKKERVRRVESIAEAVMIGNLLTHRPDELSGGQQQRVAIARALISRPRIIFADEPTANLDSTTASIILDLMSEMNRITSTTFVVATHDPTHIRPGRRVIQIGDGRIVEDYRK